MDSENTSGRRIHVWAVGKWKSKRRDFHFSTGPTACGSKAENHFSKKPQLASPRARKRGHFYRDKAGDISNEA